MRDMIPPNPSALGRASDKIAAQKRTLHLAGNGRRTREQLLMNEMRHNKASLDFNRAMSDYDDEHEGEKVSRADERPSTNAS